MCLGGTDRGPRGAIGWGPRCASNEFSTGGQPALLAGRGCWPTEPLCRSHTKVGTRGCPAQGRSVRPCRRPFVGRRVFLRWRRWRLQPTDRRRGRWRDRGLHFWGRGCALALSSVQNLAAGSRRVSARVESRGRLRGPSILAYAPRQAQPAEIITSASVAVVDDLAVGAAAGYGGKGGGWAGGCGAEVWPACSR